MIIIGILGGFVAGSINTLAGNGSAITLGILTEVMGVPGAIANGTNRLGIFFQSLASTYEFNKHGKVPIQRNKLIIFVTVFGAIFGVSVATRISNEEFREVYKYMMVVMLLLILIKPERWIQEGKASFQPNKLISIPLFFAIGFYGGFIQLGMGLFFLAAMVLVAKRGMIESNALKLVVITIYTAIVILTFAKFNMVDWKHGFIIASGQGFGGWITAKYASKNKNAAKISYYVLVTVIVLVVAKLFIMG